MENTVTTTANGQAQVSPDKAQVQLELTAEADSATEAQKTVESLESAVRDTLLTETQMSENQIRATDFEVRHREDQFDPDQTQHDYRAVKNIQVHTRPEQTGNIVVTATDAGASIRYVEFSLKKSTHASLEEKALESAVKRARTKAAKIAKTENASIGTVYRLEEAQPDGMQTIVDDALQHGSDQDFQATPISVSVEVEATYELLSDS